MTVWRLEALAVDDAGTGLIVLLLTDPHLLEGGEGGQDRAADPDGVFTLRWGNDLQTGMKNIDWLIYLGTSPSSGWLQQRP